MYYAFRHSYIVKENLKASNYSATASAVLFYADNPPAALVQEIIDEYASRGESITSEDAAAKVRFDSIDAVIEEDVKERWPDVYESMCEKMAYNHFSYMQKALRAAQEKKEHAPEQHGHGMKFK